ncbi:AI-2E family transporter [Lachnoanaerobaculum umeaense]|uniref:AI-2E family transporter n=1 Tax=Lachnoanaerobaculum umeaense TaxID=617123 RepID=A0A385Q2I0_9FIRM|nr:AI-2E family transporter [Lachnoanaerobaculum umeaense]AYB00543.1 AI-2E family transporter [Lachnoanaerobaculum umeaense]PZW91519.1 putative PurR-regulated permease PerM [Lachnoanaerobaculum umeaense]
MKYNKNERYFKLGLTAVVVIIIALVISLVFNNLGIIASAIRIIISTISSVLYGVVMAFLMAPVYDRISRWIGEILSSLFPKWKKYERYSKMLATLACLIILIFIVFALIMMIIPELVNSITNVISYAPSGAANLENWLKDILNKNPDFEKLIIGNYQDISERLSDIATTSILPNVNTYIKNLSSGVINALGVVVNIIIGLMVMMYLLNMKTILASQAKKIVYAIVGVKIGNEIVTEARYIKNMFEKFIVGKIIDSIIIGIINYFFMSFIHMPYVLLISVVVGVTNVIPFFGPFIGAIPSIVLLLLVSPITALQFAVWILVLQQIDGNIIGPKILGQTTGLPSFWVLFSILLFGGLFGIVGMIIAVPTWAIIYRTIGRLSEHFLKKKGLETDSKHYMDLDHIDEETKKYIKLE